MTEHNTTAEQDRITNELSRRGALKAGVGAAGALGALALTSGTASADDGFDDIDDDLISDQEFDSGEIARLQTAHGNYQLRTPSARETAGIFSGFVAMPLMAAAAAGASVADPDPFSVDGMSEYVHEWMFGPFELDFDPARKEEVDVWLGSNIDTHREALSQMLIEFGPLDDLLPRIYNDIESKTLRYRQEDSDRAVDDVIELVTDDVMDTIALWQQNYLTLTERVNLVYSGLWATYAETSAQFDDWTMDDFGVAVFKRRHNVDNRSSIYSVDRLQTIEGDFELVNGETYSFNSIQMLQDGDDAYDDGTTINTPMNWTIVETHEDSDRLPDLHEMSTNIHNIYDDHDWDRTRGENRVRGFVFDNENYDYQEFDDIDANSDFVGKGYFTLDAFTDVEKYGNVSYSDLPAFVNTVENEIEDYVTGHFNDIPDHELQNIENISASAEAEEAGVDWAVTEDTDFARFAEMERGGYSTDGSTSIEVFENAADESIYTDEDDDKEDIDWEDEISDEEPDHEYEDVHIVVQEQGEQIDEDDIDVDVDEDDEDDEDVKTEVYGLLLDEYYRAGGDAVGSVVVYHEDERLRYDDDDVIRITDHTDADGDSLGYFPLRTRGVRELSNDDLEAVIERRNEQLREIERLQDRHDDVLGSGMRDGSDNTLLYAALGAAAAGLAAFGLGGNN